MPITPRVFAERGHRRAASLGIDPNRVPPGQSPTAKWTVHSYGGYTTAATLERGALPAWTNTSLARAGASCVGADAGA